MEPEYIDLAQLDNNMAGLLLKLTGNDIEGNHVDADMILMDILEKLSLHKTLEAYRAIEKWYA